jgi:hypothetical protein
VILSIHGENRNTEKSLGLYTRILLKWALEKYNVKLWIGINWLRISSTVPLPQYLLSYQLRYCTMHHVIR